MPYEDFERRIEKLEKENEEKVTWFSLVSLFVGIVIVIKIIDYFFR